jgi:hypothetical protein
LYAMSTEYFLAASYIHTDFSTEQTNALQRLITEIIFLGKCTLIYVIYQIKIPSTRLRLAQGGLNWRPQQQRWGMRG